MEALFAVIFTLSLIVVVLWDSGGSDADQT